MFHTLMCITQVVERHNKPEVECGYDIVTKRLLVPVPRLIHDAYNAERQRKSDRKSVV